MTIEEARLAAVCPVLVSADIQRTVKYYVEVLGFWSARHYDRVETFAALYRDAIEFVIVQAKHGQVESNARRFGAGYDAYINPATVSGVDLIYDEYRTRGVKILQAPRLTDYGSYEFVIEDIDGRQIGIGRVQEEGTFFKESERP